MMDARLTQEALNRLIDMWKAWRFHQGQADAFKDALSVAIANYERVKDGDGPAS